MDSSWKHPFSAIISGPSGCGKSVFVLHFLEHLWEMCKEPFSEIIWYYGQYKPDSVKAPVVFREGLPDLESVYGPGSKLLIIDDLMRESDARVVDLFTKGCHHGNISLLFITQNIFHQGKGQRDMSLNTHYMVIFKNPRDKAQIRHLARQVCPERPLFLQEAYTDATSNPFGYLLLDMKQETPDEFRFRTCIFPTDPINYVYVPKSL